MPANGISLSPKSHIMTYEEIFTIAKEFVDNGVTKIRLTGGEPLVRKDVGLIMEKLATLPVELAITTNGVIVDKFIAQFKKISLRKINVSLDSLNNDKNTTITRRDYFMKVCNNIQLLVEEGFEVKVNCVLMTGFNENEIIDFIELTKLQPLQIRFIEFMPFDGNKWNFDKLVSLEDILMEIYTHYGAKSFVRLKDAPNDTAKNYQIKNYKGSFAVISSVTNPFCDNCNRIRLTANGQLKNCLFSISESDLLTPLRNGQSIVPIIQKAVTAKKKIRSGMETLEQFKDPDSHNNRSMIAIGG
jgi:cyclic pyranopterin phosphate synthase